MDGLHIKQHTGECTRGMRCLTRAIEQIGAGVYLGYRAAFALQQGITFVDVEHLLAWRCVRLRHGIMTHVVVIVVGSVLKAAMPDFMMRQVKLIALKLAVVPLLFHGSPPLPSSAASTLPCMHALLQHSHRPRLPEAAPDCPAQYRLPLALTMHANRCQPRVEMRLAVNCRPGDTGLFEEVWRIELGGHCRSMPHRVARSAAPCGGPAASTGAHCSACQDGIERLLKACLLCSSKQGGES